MKHRKVSVLVMSALFAVLIAGCNTTLSLDTDNLERLIRDEIQSQTGLTVTEVVCPDRPLLQGDEFTCSASTADGRSLTIAVTQTDAAGNVNFRFQEN